MFLVDSHCHLDGLDYESLHKDVDDVLAKAAARDVKFCLAVATTLPGYLHMRDLVGERDNVVLNRPGFPGECFICELRLPDQYFRWKHNKLFLLL
ncbi:hypothetical protein ACRWE7_20235, partial [Escherichia coli]